MLFGDFIGGLISQGKTAEAARYRRIMYERFEGVLTPQQINGKDVEVLAKTLLEAEAVAEQLQEKKTGFAAYVADLQAQGFAVSVGEKYRCLLQ